MKKFSPEAEKIMIERFGKDTVIALATVENNPTIAISGEWFTAHGKGINLGYFGKEENHLIAEKLKNVFAEWIDNGHNNFNDENTIILCVELTDGLLLSHGTRYEF
ncbi:pyridoxamine 5'-phosphate oxidase family protein [Schaedlerella arabinosiphila]|jgi:hypothetical protein|uniref:Pyridoxamine 5'-phosphate oxidase family protein n=1 Tax=Schaedlerella arabinosiphila TaxID=2044587 RepID=A0A3R8L0T7_9FIRM|nr:pyridoxamine 5'-phosphate oxidase family protein [Schaedlerella arabinosiphila]RRK33961.1 pyridoxamine 5'-phosphate oxidase family protein [Schaedlerella arabinosiphila]